MPAIVIKLILLLVFCCSLFNESAFAVSENMNRSLPLFIENIGQITDQFGNQRNDIDFKINFKGLNIFIGNGQIHYHWYKRSKKELSAYRLDAILINGNLKAKAQGLQPHNYFERYYLEHTTSTEARSFEKIIYRDIYPNIDWVIYFDENKLKYEFVLREGADVNDIKIKYWGAVELANLEGDIIISTPYGNLTEKAPYTYENYTKNEIPSFYQLNERTIKFKVDTEQEGNFTIDPTLEWGTYFGGAGIDNGYALTIDTNNNVYMAGATESTTNIATSGAHQTSLSGSQDACIVKFSPAGIKLWSTYFGGPGDEIFFSLAKNNDNDFIIGGVNAGCGS